MVSYLYAVMIDLLIVIGFHSRGSKILENFLKFESGVVKFLAR